MKIKKMSKKLVLNKITISNMKDLMGGDLDKLPYTYGQNSCPTIACFTVAPTACTPQQVWACADTKTTID
jgi:hypothetical protein